MSYQEKCEKLYRDNRMLKDTLKTIIESDVSLDNVFTCIEGIDYIKAIAKTILAVVSDEE